MPATKRCVYCNTLNSDGTLYCTNCGKYLTDRKAASIRVPTIWERSAAVSASPPSALNAPARRAPQYVAVCPQCGNKEPAAGQTLPMMCSACSYFFQTGIDRIVNAAAPPPTPPVPKQSARTVQQPAPQPAPAQTAKRSPMPHIAEDTSAMRLFWINRPNAQPVSMRPTAEIIGANGTVLPQLKDAQVSVRHTASGWYALCMQGVPMLNGVPMNRGISYKLKDGDILTFGREQLSAEII